MGHYDTIDTLLDAARRAFPQIPLTAEVLRAHQTRLAMVETEATISDSQTDVVACDDGAALAAQELSDEDTFPPEAPLTIEPGMPEPSCALDWVLAAGCAASLPQAIAHVERTVLHEVPLFIRRIDASASFSDELVQILRERLFVASPSGGAPRISLYSGRGPLGAWIRVISVRLALEMKRKESALAPENAADRLVDLALGPEEEVAKNEHSNAAQQALRLALGELNVRQRNLLRLRFAEGWSPEELGKTYSVHRGTIARWIQDARSQVKVAMARELAKILGFSEDEMPSVMRAVESRLELTFSMLKP